MILSSSFPKSKRRIVSKISLRPKVFRQVPKIFLNKARRSKNFSRKRRVSKVFFRKKKRGGLLKNFSRKSSYAYGSRKFFKKGNRSKFFFRKRKKFKFKSRKAFSRRVPNHLFNLMVRPVRKQVNQKLRPLVRNWKISAFEEPYPRELQIFPKKKEAFEALKQRSLSLVKGRKATRVLKLRLNIPLHLKALRRTLAPRLWPGSRKWRWKTLYRLPFNKNLRRFYNRVVQLPASRLRFFYWFDIFILWIYFFYKKIERMLFYFFHELWCNIYFMLETSNHFLPKFTSWLFLPFSLWRGHYSSFLRHSHSLILALRRSLLQKRFQLFTSFNFTRFFKLGCVFWNKHKDKLYLQGYSQWRWRRKVKHPKAKKRKYIPGWKRSRSLKSTTRFFLSKKRLRWQFRRQHGRRRIRRYYLRMQLRGLKWRKLRPRRRFRFLRTPPSRVKTWGLVRSHRDGKVIKGSRIFLSLAFLKRTFLIHHRKAFLTKHIQLKQRVLNTLPFFKTKARRRLRRHLSILLQMRSHLFKLKTAKQFKVWKKFLHQKGVLKLSKRSKRVEEVALRLKQLRVRKRVVYLRRRFIIRRLQRKIYFLRRRLLYQSRKFDAQKVFFRQRPLKVSFAVFNKLLHQRDVFKHLRKKLSKLKSKLLTFTFRSRPKSLRFLRTVKKNLFPFRPRNTLGMDFKKKKTKFLRLRKRSRYRLGRFRKLKYFPKKLRRRVLRKSSFSFLYSKLLTGQILFRKFKRLSRLAKKNKRLTMLGRRKLLFFVRFKKLSWRKGILPSFLFRVAKKKG